MSQESLDGPENKEGGESVILFFGGEPVSIEINHKNTTTPKVRGPDH